MRRALVALLVVAPLMGAAAQEAQEVQETEGAEPLLPGDVAESAAEHYPAVLTALAERRGAAGRVLTARGAFDAVVSVEGRTRAAGFYSGDDLDVRIERPLGAFGAKAYGAYRLSDGTFPIYEDERYTNESGELKIGLLFSLLRDRAIDDRRFGIRRAELNLRQADFELLLTRIAVQNQALQAYYRWVAEGRKLSVYEDLLDLAEARVAALEAEVARGARAAIFLTENAQNLTRRQELVTTARRDLALAANALSLYLRAPNGAPIVPDRDRLPTALPLPDPVEIIAGMDVLANRPELAVLDAAAERIGLELRLAENQLRPRLDVVIEAGQDLGPIAPEAGVTRDEGEMIAGLRFEVPLGRRAAKGALAQARAERDALIAERRLARDRIAAELADIALTLSASRQLLDLAEQEVRQAEIMRRAEQRRFEGGASDFFLVNLREEALASSRVRYAEARLALAAARATYDAAVLDLGRLGLSSRSLLTGPRSGTNPSLPRGMPVDAQLPTKPTR